MTVLGGLLDRAVDLGRRRPHAALAFVLGVHLVVWTLLPILVCHNLQLDLAEDLALGREWQLGYWKHPPLPWWAADLLYRITGSIYSVYLLGPLSAVLAMYFVWRLACEFVPREQALIAVLALEGIHFYNFSAVKFAHDQMQLPFWALTGWFVARAILHRRIRDWMLAGCFLALAFWSKYAAFALAATIGLLLVFDPAARRAWRTPGPYLMAVTFLVVLAPNLWWLVDSGFLPFRYVDDRAVAAAHWYQYLLFPLRWAVGQGFFLLPAIALLAIVLFGAETVTPAGDRDAVARRIVTALAVGPFAVTTLISLALGRQAVAMWGYPLWLLAPLAALMWLPPIMTARRLRLLAATFVCLFAAWPIGYAADEVLEPMLRSRPKATQYPGRLLAETVTRQWREETGTPLRYVGGANIRSAGMGEFPANNVAIYSPDRPQVIVHGDPRISPWIDSADLKRRGAVLIWVEADLPAAAAAELRAHFPGLKLRTPLSLPLHRSGKPLIFGYAFVPPAP